MKADITFETISTSIDIDWKIAHEQMSIGGPNYWGDMCQKLDALWSITLYAAATPNEEREEMLDAIKLLEQIARQHRFDYINRAIEVAAA